jgi:hypothetical protein
MRRTRKPPPAVPEHLITALLPDVHAEPPPHSPAPPPTLPTPTLPTSSVDGLLVGMARIDRSGRLHERQLLRALGRMPGHRLTLDVVHGLIVVQSAPAAPHVLDHRGALHLPAAARRMCGIHTGPPVMLAAAVSEQTLVIHSAAIAAGLLAAHYADLLDGRDER